MGGGGQGVAVFRHDTGCPVLGPVPTHKYCSDEKKASRHGGTGLSLMPHCHCRNEQPGSSSSRLPLGTSVSPREAGLAAWLCCPPPSGSLAQGHLDAGTERMTHPRPADQGATAPLSASGPASTPLR